MAKYIRDDGFSAVTCKKGSKHNFNTKIPVIMARLVRV